MDKEGSSELSARNEAFEWTIGSAWTEEERRMVRKHFIDKAQASYDAVGALLNRLKSRDKEISNSQEQL